MLFRLSLVTFSFLFYNTSFDNIIIFRYQTLVMASSLLLKFKTHIQTQITTQYDTTHKLHNVWLTLLQINTNIPYI